MSSIDRRSLAERYAQLAVDVSPRPRDSALRALDLAIASADLLLLAPLGALIALGVLMTSGRPVFYRGERVGRYGRVFAMRKFRTLRPDAELRLGGTYGAELTARMPEETTPFGRFLRASQLDELPQLWNVLRGDMSVVGPRPVRPVFFEQLANEIPRVLAAARRPAGSDRVRADADGPRGVVGGEARARPRVDRRPIGAPVPAHRRGDRRSRGAAVGRADCSGAGHRLTRMCGICGIALPQGEVDPRRLVTMRDTLVHRGPDAPGLVVDGPVGLGARRLSIIDLETGDQPLANEDGTVHVVQNGEIYNYRELRRELEQPRGTASARTATPR